MVVHVTGSIPVHSTILNVKQKEPMGTPQAVISISFELADGTIVSFDQADILPGAHYSTSRNFTRPARKRKPNEPKIVPETWIRHEIHFNTTRETVDSWQQRVDTT